MLAPYYATAGCVWKQNNVFQETVSTKLEFVSVYFFKERVSH